MRPKKTRWIKCDSNERVFKPQGKSFCKKNGVVLTLDEFEAVRLLDLQKLSQEEVAKKMKVHRSTVSRIISSAHQKIAKALVSIETLTIEGGCCKIIKGG